MNIGVLSQNYAAKRLFLNKVENAKYINIRFNNWFLLKNWHLWALKLLGWLNMSAEEQASKLLYDYKEILHNKCDFYHFFNTINHDNNKWVISVESGVPWTLDVIKCIESPEPNLYNIRNDKYIAKAIKILANQNCMGLLALSQCSRNIQIEITRQFPEYYDAINNKLITLYPPQDVIVRSLEEKSKRKRKDLTFIYIGRDFFRKGGRETLEVLTALHSSYNFRLILISDLRIDEPKYLITNNEVKKTYSLIESNSSWVEYYPYLDNNIVLQKIIESDVALLPTWMDTFGYSVLECQACGTPVVTTSLRALTEINPVESGWLINVPVNRLNNPIHNTYDEKITFYNVLKTGLQRSIQEILSNPDIIYNKACNSISRIQQIHSPSNYLYKLLSIYNKVVK